VERIKAKTQLLRGENFKMQSNQSHSKSLNLIVIPHSHWDREWFETFEAFRFYLVEFMDRLMERLETDPDLRSFLLDGQMILIEDYLEIHPENKERLYRLIRNGRIEIGPWYVQPDEFLVSGESLVRNLLIGDRLAKQIAPIMKQGYIPDTFGHIHQLPQIFNGFGIHTFYFMRGLGEDINDLRSEFWWEAPDGSKVLSHYLSESYSNAGVLNPDPDKMEIHHGKNVNYDSLWELRSNLASRTDSNVLLLLNGSDHMTFQEDFSQAVSGLNEAMIDRMFNGKLEDFAKLVLESGAALKTIRGELRFGRYHPVLKDVLSTRMYIKQANEKAQQLLENRVERFASLALVLGGKDYSGFLNYAWKELLKNHPHDSICGCSIDAVHREMMTRYNKVNELGEKILDDSLHYLASQISPAAEEEGIPIVIFNPSPWERRGNVHADVLLKKKSPLGIRKFGYNQANKDIDLTQYTLFDADGNAVPFISLGDHVTVEDALQRRKVLIRETIQFQVSAIPAFGYQVYRLIPLVNQGKSASESDRRARELPVLENEYLKVTSEKDGTLTIEDKISGRIYNGFHQFEDEADAGDEYTFSPPERQSTVSSTQFTWKAEAGSDPYTLILRGELELPESLSADRKNRSEETVICPITSFVQLLPNAKRVEVRTEFDNSALDHRFRVLFPTGFQVEESIAETSFGTIKRPVVPESCEGWREKTSPTYAQRRFVCIENQNKGVAILNKGLPEYEATPDGKIYLTLLRAVGWLSRQDLITRKGNAGPGLATPDAQSLGRQVYEYAIVPYQGNWEDAEIYCQAEEFWLPLEAKTVQSIQNRANVRQLSYPSFLQLDSKSIVLSSVKKAEDDDSLIIRMFNPTERKVNATLTFGLPLASVYRTNLNEENIEELDFQGHKLYLSLDKAKIETLRIRLL
jgi:mannosylglycerate hydrolase